MRRRELLWMLLGLGACGRSSSSQTGGDPRPAPRDDEGSDEPARAADPGPLGSLDEVPVSLRPAFDVGPHAPAPARVIRSGEPPQTFAAFLAEDPPRPKPDARTVAILPIGEYPRGFMVEYDAVRLVRSPELALLARFVEAWFGLPTRVLPAMDDEVLEQLPSRELDGHRQLDASAILEWLRARRPADATCILALTLEDLFAEDAAWVFGFASIAQRVGVHSMLRYDPGFEDTDARGPAFERVILTRALRVLAHEVAHMFGLRHCVHFACIMNPTAGLDDLDALPLRACPVCLRKLWSVSDMHLVDRWERLVDLCAELGLDDERAWFAARLHALGVAAPSFE